MRRKKDRASEIRSDIVDAAARVFGANGYERATLDEIAAIVGIQKGSLYHHIDSKEQLLFAIHLRLYAEVDRSMDAAGSDPDASALENLARLVGAIVETIAKHREMANVFLREYRALGAEHLEEHLRHRRLFIKRVESVVRQVITEQKRTDLDVRHTVYAIIGMCYWVNEWLDGRDIASPGQAIARDDHRAIGETFCKLLIDGFRAGPITGDANATTRQAPKKKAKRNRLSGS